MRNKLSAPLLASVLKWINDSEGWQWREKYIEHDGAHISAWLDGRVNVWALEFLPFDWTQRRSIARAVKRKHKAMTEKLVRAGIEALKAKQT